VVQAWRCVIDDDACIIRLALLLCAVGEFQRLAARALRIPIMDGNGFSGLAEGLIEQDRDGAFSNAAFFRQESDLHGVAD